MVGGGREGTEEDEELTGLGMSFEPSQAAVTRSCGGKKLRRQEATEEKTY